MKTSIVIIGAGGHAISVANVAHSKGITVLAYVDDNKAGGQIMDVPIISKQQCFATYAQTHFAIAVGDNALREQLYQECRASMPEARFPALIHQSAVVGIGADIGDGTVVMPFANIGPQSKIGQFCIINTKASIDHDGVMEAFASLAPGVVCGGDVRVGARSAISIGAKVKHGVTMGSDVVIGADSYVHSNVEDLVVAYGSPSKTIRQRQKGEPYLS